MYTLYRLYCIKALILYYIKILYTVYDSYRPLKTLYSIKALACEMQISLHWLYMQYMLFYYSALKVGGGL